MKFNSQICTTKEQSERLMTSGLRVETADCILVQNPFYTDEYVVFPRATDNIDLIAAVPAWSLHRLIEMLNYQVIHNGKKYEPVIAIDGMAYQDVCNDDAAVGWHGDLYTDIIDCIEWLISIEQFNIEYLEE